MYHLHPQLSPDGAEGGVQRQGNLVLSSEKVVGAWRIALQAGNSAGADPLRALRSTSATVPHVAR